MSSKSKSKLKSKSKSKRKVQKQSFINKPIFFYINCALLIISFVFIYPYIFDSKFDLNGDNFNYLNFGEAIAKGYGYISPNTPNHVPQNWYPPGYPIIIASIITGIIFC